MDNARSVKQDRKLSTHSLVVQLIPNEDHLDNLLVIDEASLFPST
eukprot:CAMPEP_0201935578 /NCGR_PEP_ID=MMETSP0903-20130614/35779_1 /ASSEMBLY_ACC=CAM_ASM_000552 /TAXON_ID=420261 /ORGANISM="Thalassiosira antarctica, Strain CCMP982" /LENGTH=44 /DNA_ID= /DNA_START= /DNA_END= /DNA_ORIENTATION=